MKNLQFEINLINLYLYDTVLRILEFEIELYLVRQIPDNTDRVISGSILRNLEFEIELYLVRQIPENMEGYT